MKKALSVICIALVLVMMLSVCTFATESDTNLAELGQSTYYTGSSFTATEAMTVDGRLGEAEGWVCITPDYASRTSIADEYRFNSWKENSTVALGDDTTDRASNFKFYVAQTDTDIYFAIEDCAPYFEVDGVDGFTKACESICRNNYNIRLGFDAENYDRYVHIREFNSLDQFNICGPDGYKNMKSVYGDIVTYSFARFAEDGSHLYDGNKNTTNQHYWTKPATKWTAILEIKLSKAMIKDMYVEYFGEGADTNIDFASMFISVSAGGAIADPAESNKYSWVYTVYGGTMLSSEEATEKGVTERAIPDLVVFGKDPNEVAPAESEDATDDPIENVPAESKEDNTKKSEKADAIGEDTVATSGDSVADIADIGCGGAVSVIGVAIIATLGTCAAFVSKKKED